MNRLTNAPAQLTADDARAAGARFLTGDVSLLWRQAADTWVDIHFPIPLPDKGDEQFTERMDVIAEAYIDGIRTRLIEALGNVPHAVIELDRTELATTLIEAAEQFSTAAAVVTMMAETLRALIDEANPRHPSATARLAAEASIRVGRQTARELSAAHNKLTLEAERYDNDR